MPDELDRGEDSPAMRRQLAAVYRDRIEAGELSPGDRLPSAGQMAQLNGCHTDTAKAAVTILAHEGLVRVYPRTGAVVAGDDPVAEQVIEGPATIRARMPTAPERHAMDIPPGVPMLVVTQPDTYGRDDDEPGEIRTQYLGHVTALVIP